MPRKRRNRPDEKDDTGGRIAKVSAKDAEMVLLQLEKLQTILKLSIQMMGDNTIEFDGARLAQAGISQLSTWIGRLSTGAMSVHSAGQEDED